MKRPAAILVLALSVAAGFLVLRQGPTTTPSGSGGSTMATRPQPPVEAATPEPRPADGGPSIEQPPTPLSGETSPPPGEAAPSRSANDLRDEAHRLLGQGNVAEGLEAMKKAVELDPSARNQGELGDLYVRLTVIDTGIRYLRAAAELDPTNADRWIALANAYYLEPNPGEAWKAERQAREAEPGLQLGRDARGLRIRRGDSTTTDQ